MANPAAWIYWPGRPGGYSLLSYDIIPYTQANQFVYWAFQYSIIGAPGSGGYCGLQTKGSDDFVPPNPPAINFSQWNVFTGDPSYIEPNFAAEFSGEGVGWQNHSKYPWVPGKRYRIQVRIGEDNNKIMASVNGQWIGAAAMPSGGTAFDNAHVLWGEIYGAPSVFPARALVKNFYAGYDYDGKRDFIVPAYKVEPDVAKVGPNATVTPKDGGWEYNWTAAG